MTNFETHRFVVTQDKTQDTVANYVTGEVPGNRSCQDLSKNELLINMVTLVYVKSFSSSKKSTLTVLF